MLPIIFEPPAQEELDSAHEWYETARPGLGDEFVAAVRTTISRIQDWPELHATVYKEVRQAKIERFPYNVFYRVESKRILVLAVFHGSRDPTVWRRRAR